MTAEAKSDFIVAVTQDNPQKKFFKFDDFRRTVTTACARKEYTLESGSVSLEYTPGTSVHEYKECIICIHGTVYSPEPPSQAILRYYLQSPDSFAKNLNGSFAILVIDKNSGAILVATDRINSRKVFCEKGPLGEQYFFTSLYFRHHDRTINTAGLSSFLVNGYPFGGSTVFNECRALDRATIYKLKDGRLSATRYWDITYHPAKRSFASFEKDLSDIILHVVKIRLAGKKKIFLSLSGGYDSAGILGALHSLKAENVHCISYKSGDTVHPRSDEYIGRQRALVYGFNHEYAETYSGDLMEIYDLNAKHGQLLSVCDDALVWKRKANDATPYEERGLFVGDQFDYGDRGLILHPPEYLNSTNLSHPDKIPLLKELTAPGHYARIRESIDGLYQAGIRAFPSFSDKYEMRNYIFHDIRTFNLLMSWRENFLGRFADVLNPFVDNDYIDFLCTLPVSYQFDKTFFIHTVKKMFPEIFIFPSVITYSFMKYQERAFRDHADALRPLFAKEVPGFSDFFPPEKLTAALNAYLQRPPVEVPFPPRLTLLKRAKLGFLNSPFGNWLYDFRRFTPETVTELHLLKRIAIALLFFGNFDMKSR